MRSIVTRNLTGLSAAIVPVFDSDRPDPDDPEVQRIARERGVPAEFIANIAEESFNAVICKKGFRPPMEDILCAVEVAAIELQEKALTGSR
jgi:hypothetical protein